jgi:RND family efflux transporter MFP subunit
MNARRCARTRFGLGTQIVLSILLFVAGCSPKDANNSDGARPVKTMVVAAGGDTHVRSFPGKVEASKRVELAFQVSGLLVQLPVREGQRVAKGELVAQLRQEDFQARLQALQGQLDQARAGLKALQAGERQEQRMRLEAQVRAADAVLARNRIHYERVADLQKAGSSSPTEYERAQTEYRVAQEELTAAQQALEKGLIARAEDIAAKEAAVRGLEARVVEANLQLHDSTLEAPYDGIIARRFVELKQNIRAKDPVVAFQDVDEIEIVVDVPETVMAANLLAADIVELVAAFSAVPGLQFPVHVKEIAQRADPVTQTFQVRVAMKAPTEVKLLPGMTAIVTLTYRRAAILGNQILVPVSAVLSDGATGQAAWVIGPDETVKRRPVKLGEPTGGQIEILDGLQPGERIAVAGVTFLREGMKVRDLGDALGGVRP